VHHITTPGDALYGQELEPAEFAAKYSPSPSQVQSVVTYLSAAGFKNLQVEPNNLVISADGTAAAVRQAFNTH
jgi:pseudomonalisin